MSIPFLNIFLSPGGMRHRKYAACPKGSKKQLPLSEKYVIMHKNLFLRAMSQAAVLARTVGECRKGQIPRPLGRCKLDTPLLAAGSLIILEEAGFFGTMVDADESYPYMVETLIRPLKNEYGGEDR